MTDDEERGYQESRPGEGEGERRERARDLETDKGGERGEREEIVDCPQGRGSWATISSAVWGDSCQQYLT